MTTAEFNRVMRAMGRTALEAEDALAVVYERGWLAAARFYASQFSGETVTAAADWVPPAGAAQFDTAAAMAAAERQRLDAAEAIQKEFARGVSDLAISFDPARFQIFSPDLLISLGQHAGANFDASARDTLSRTIQQSFDSGLSVPDTAKAIRTEFGNVSKSTATMLARTDLISLANGGSYMAARKVFRDQAVEKVWLNAHDARVRPSHAEAGGQRVPMEAPFRVGGFDLMYPGDPQGPPQEVIQCRCTYTVEDVPASRSEPEESQARARSEALLEQTQAQAGGVVSASAGTTDAMAATDTTGTRWRSVLVLEGVETDDGRLIDPGALDWRDLPLTLMGMTVTGPGGHEGAEVAGRIDTITRNDRTGEVIGEGVFDSGDFGTEVTRMVGDEVLRGVSVDLAIREFELRGPDGQALDEDADPFTEDRIIFAVTDASIMGATVCPFPAFADAHIELLASADPNQPPDRARFVTGPITIVAAAGEGATTEASVRNALAAAERAIVDLREAFGTLTMRE